MSTRKDVRVQVIEKTESGLSLVTDAGVRYHWVSRAYNSPLFYARTGEWFSVSLTEATDSWGRLVAKNVRVLK